MAQGKVKLPEDSRLRNEVGQWIYEDLGPDLEGTDEEEGEFDLPKDRQTAEAAADLLERVAQVLRTEAPNLPEMEEKEQEEPETDQEAAPEHFPEAG